MNTLSPPKMQAADADPVNAIPRSVLLAMGALVLVSLLAVAAGRLSGNGFHAPDAAAVSSRSLRFEDRSDGSVAILDGRSGETIERVQGEAGFLRGALRVLTRERRMRDLGPEVPFELVARADGRLTLMDPATGTRIDLESFGPTNAATFARLLPATTPAQAAAPSRSTP